jgi:cytochrome oxidase Cu insertion factor (SCO1/SenC/PrrC family)
LRRGTIPPALEANDLDGNRYALEQSKGKLVFLSFINSNCTACLSNLELLRTVYEQNRSDLEVVTIITDRDTLQANNLANILNYKWKVLISPQNYQLLDDYKVYGYPLELVLDRQGAIWQYPARSLEEHLIPLLTNLPANKTIRQGFQPIRKK